MESFGKSRNFYQTSSIRISSLLLIYGLASIFILGGCATPSDLHQLSDQKLQKVSDRDLCEAYFYGQGENVRRELERRKLISETQWSTVHKNIVRKGMKECSVRAAWGAPEYTFAHTQSDRDKILVFQGDQAKIQVDIAEGRVKAVNRHSP